MTGIFAGKGWERIRERMHENWDGLSEPDLDWVSGSRERLRTCLCRVYGISCRLAEVEIDNFEDLYRETLVRPGRKCLSKRIHLRFSMSRIL